MHSTWLLTSSNHDYHLVDSLLLAHSVSPKSFQEHVTSFPLALIEKRIKAMIKLDNSPLSLWRALNIYDDIAKELEKQEKPPRVKILRLNKKALVFALLCIDRLMNSEIDETHLIIKTITLLNRVPGPIQYRFDGISFTNTDQLAVHMCHYLLSKYPHDTTIDQTWYLLASVHYRSGRFVDALDCYEQAIKINPKQLVYQHQYKSVLFQLDQFKPYLKSILGIANAQTFGNEPAQVKWSRFCEQVGINPEIKQLQLPF